MGDLVDEKINMNMDMKSPVFLSRGDLNAKENMPRSSATTETNDG